MKITPINEAAIKKELAENPAPQPHPQPQAVDVPPPVAPDQASQVPASPTVAPGVGDTRIGDVQGLRLYALVVIILSAINLLGVIDVAFYALQGRGPLSIAHIITFITSILPIAGGLYLLLGKSKLVISAVLVVLGIAYAGNLINTIIYANAVIALIIYSPLAILSLALLISLFVWTILVFKRVRQT